MPARIALTIEILSRPSVMLVSVAQDVRSREGLGLIDVRRTLLVVARAIEKRFDAFRFGLKQRLGLLDPFEILPIGIRYEQGVVPEGPRTRGDWHYPRGSGRCRVEERTQHGAALRER